MGESDYEYRYGDVKSFTTSTSSGGGSSPAAGQGWFGCYEIPAMTITGSLDEGEESHGVNDVYTNWCGAYVSSTQRMVTHTFMYNNKVLRNYTVLMDKNVHGPLWSAKAFSADTWPDNGIGRKGNWGYDPGFDEDWQQSGVSGYSKGHLTASNDAQTALVENKETFYYSNQAPQIQNGFNGTVWNDLEKYIQSNRPTSSANNKSDTLYVVTGCIYESGSTSSVPKKWYKCLMLCTFSAPGVIDTAKGCAYLFDNKAYTKGTDYNTFQDFRETIDTIEGLTGFDFFPLVPANLQQTAESSTAMVFKEE